MNIQVKITHFDTAMALIEIGSIRLLTDPVFDPPGSHFEYGPIVLEKTSRPLITPSELGRIDAVLLSHDQHADNLDTAGRLFLPSAGNVITTPLAASRLQELNNVIGLESFAQTSIHSSDGTITITITAVPAQHGPDGTEAATGPVTGFIVDWPNRQSDSGPIYLSGDTIRFAGTEEIASRYAPIGLALLNLGRVRLVPMGDAEFSLSATEALAYARSLKASSIVPLHVEGWRHFSEARDEAIEIFNESELATRTCWLSPGIPTTFEL